MWKRALKIITHTDFDGICCSALFIRKYGIDVEIIYATVQQAEILNIKSVEVDYTCDLPKVGSSINIDHHQTNFENLVSSGRLTEDDIVDPFASSATDLVYEYLSFENDSIAHQIRDLGHLADTARLPSEYKPLDVVLNLHTDSPTFLRKISNLLATHGKKILELNWMIEEYNKVVSLYQTTKEIIERFLQDHPVLPEIVIIDTREIIPGKLAKEVFKPFFKNNAIVVALIYKKSKDGPVRVSFRVTKSKQEDYDVSVIAKNLGGGGHRMAAGCSPDKEIIPEGIIAQLKIISKSSDKIEYKKLSSKQ
jgi:nanoRNase/pAp phosphatase (c-di-AMP/oligoRNAs hydrolase)